MWSKELAPDSDDEDEEEVKNRVGDRETWYKKQVDYWSVRLHNPVIEVR